MKSHVHSEWSLQKGEHQPKSNMIMRLQCFVEADASTGYFVWVKRKSDGREK